MRILYVCNEYPPHPYGGIGIFVNNLARELVKNNFECTVIGIYPIQRKVDENIEGVRVIRLKEMNLLFFNRFKVLRMIQNTVNKFRLSYFISKFEKQTRPNLIESYEWNGPLLFKPKTKLVVRLHGSNSAHAEFEGKKTNRIIRYFENRNLQFADEILSVSNHLLTITEKTFGAFKVPKSTLYNSYDDSIFKIDDSVNRHSNKILFVGKFHERKGVYELFPILNHLFSYSMDYTFHFVGAHNDENQVELLSLLKPEDRSRVTFTKAIPQYSLPAIYNESTLMILPSRAEAFGLTAIEAMACGCVVAMSDLPVAYEIIDPDVNGLIINIYDYENSARKIHTFLKDSVKKKESSSKASMKIQSHFSAKAIFEQNREFYEKCIEKL